jgi:two-component system chemotaxis response regulator CheY
LISGSTENVRNDRLDPDRRRSSSLRLATRIALTGAGYTVTEACDGLEGLGKAQGQKFDMIITDLNMPNMDGLSMIREIRKLPVQMGTPIIFLTTESDDALKQEARAAGATGWLVKPFQPDQLLRIAKKVLGR